MRGRPWTPALGVSVDGFTLDPLTSEGYRPARVETTRGPVDMRLYEPEVPPLGGVVWLGGVGGGWDSPGHDIYARLCRELTAEGIASVRVKYRAPADLDEAQIDAAAAMHMLTERGCHALGVVGHSFGAAVAVRAAVQGENVHALVALATQSYGASSIARLGPHCGVLFIHGAADRVLPPASAEYLHALAPGPKRLLVLDGVGHDLIEADGTVRDLVHAFLRAWLLPSEAGRETTT